MKRTAFWAMLFLAAGITDQARSAGDGIAALGNCFKAARLADAICSSPENSPQRSLDCFQKAQSAQLECLEHISAEVTGSATPPDPPGAGSSQGPANQLKAAGALEASPVALADKITDAPAKEPQQTAQSPVPTVRPVAPPNAVTPARSAAIIRPNTPDKTAGPPVMDSDPDWIVSETTSPIDYSPVVVATMKSSANRKDAPNAFSILCRRQRTEIALRTDGAWRIAANSKVQVALQTKDNSARSLWNLSANGKIATNGDHAVDLIQSLSEGTTLEVTVSDGVDHVATFRLTGLDVVWKKISAACRHTPVADSKASLVKR